MVGRAEWDTVLFGVRVKLFTYDFAVYNIDVSKCEGYQGVSKTPAATMLVGGRRSDKL